jgi:hypothetical protein
MGSMPTTSGKANHRRQPTGFAVSEVSVESRSEAFRGGSKLARIRIVTRFRSNRIPLRARVNLPDTTHTGLVLNECKKWRPMCSAGAAWAQMKVKQLHHVLS